jgi:hypothetical protein
MANPGRARLREFHPLELILARAAPHHMAANPTIRLRSNRAHTETTVLGQLKKKQQNRAPVPVRAARSLRNVLWARGIRPISSWGVRVYPG